jgi:hypothetical protein
MKETLLKKWKLNILKLIYTESIQQNDSNENDLSLTTNRHERRKCANTLSITIKFQIFQQ